MIWKEGDTQTFTFKLPDKRSNAFVKLSVYTLGNPTPQIFSMSHLADGLYVTAPGTPLTEGQYVLVYEVFRDAGFNNRWQLYNDSSQSLRVESIQNTIQTEAQNIIDLMDDSDGRIT